MPLLAPIFVVTPAPLYPFVQHYESLKQSAVRKSAFLISAFAVQTAIQVCFSHALLFSVNRFFPVYKVTGGIVNDIGHMQIGKMSFFCFYFRTRSAPRIKACTFFLGCGFPCVKPFYHTTASPQLLYHIYAPQFYSIFWCCFLF